MAAPPPFQLPPSLQRDFRELQRLYDLRSYRPALKAADKLLKACPPATPHGDTLAYKAMALAALGRRAEAMVVGKEGLRASALKSAHAWWAMGGLHRTGGATPEAIKCFRNALRLEPDNALVARDLAFAQCHARDFAGAAATRGALLLARPNVPTTWLGLVAAHAAWYAVRDSSD